MSYEAYKYALCRNVGQETKMFEKSSFEIRNKVDNSRGKAVMPLDR